MVSALDSGLSGPGSNPGLGTALCSWARHFTLKCSLLPGVKMGTDKCNVGLTLQRTYIPSRGIRIVAKETGISIWLQHSLTLESDQSLCDA